MLLSEFDKPFKAFRLVVCALALLAMIREYTRSKKLFKEPGLWLPFVGHLYLFDIRNLAWELERLRKSVGDKVMGLHLGPEFMVYVTSPKLTHLVFAEHGDKSSDRSAPMPKELSSSNLGVVLNSGEQWWKHRTLLLRELIGSQHRTTIVCDVFDDLTRKVGQAALKNPGGVVPEFGILVHKAVAAGLCVLIFGFKLENSLVDEILEQVDYIGAKAFDYMMLVRIPGYKIFRFETVARFEACCQRMLKIVDEVLEKRQTSEDYYKGMPTVAKGAAAVGRGTTDSTGSELPHLNEVLFEAIQGGLDTTTAVIEWTIAYLTTNPLVQKRIHEEIDQVCGSNGPGIEHRAQLVLLNAAIMESLRLAQVSSVVVPHKASDDIDLGPNYPAIPKGSTLLWSFNDMHASTELWKDPFTFRPDRFLQEDAGLDPNPNHNQTAKGEFKKYMPFGIGPRHCPGYNLAMLELYVCISKLLYEYEFSSSTPVDLAHYTNSIPVRVKGFKPTVTKRAVKGV